MRNTAFFHKLHKRISALTLAVVMGASVMAVPVNSKALEAKVDVAVEDEIRYALDEIRL